MFDLDNLASYWVGAPLMANLMIALNLLGALALGMLMGYERAYNGRAAGIRTYGLVCMASAAFTVFAGYSPYWYGDVGSPMPPDPTRVIQGVITGIGFLCGGVIMKDGLSINGLTSAASLWASSAVGVLVGVGFYGAAITMALLCMLSMTVGQLIQRVLPVRDSLGIELRFDSTADATITESTLNELLSTMGYTLVESSLVITYGEASSWRFNIMSTARSKTSRAALASTLQNLDCVLATKIQTSRH